MGHVGRDSVASERRCQRHVPPHAEIACSWGDIQAASKGSPDEAPNPPADSRGHEAAWKRTLSSIRHWARAGGDAAK